MIQRPDGLFASPNIAIGTIHQKVPVIGHQCLHQQTNQIENGATLYLA